MTCFRSLLFPVQQFDRRLYASLLGQTLRPLLSLHLSVRVFPLLPFDQWSHVNLSGPTLRTLALSQGSVLCFLLDLVQALSLLPFDQWPRACLLLRVMVLSL